jgi:hypothetical protein
LEGSNPATSKYHKKKELIRNQLGSKDYESDMSESALYNLDNRDNSNNQNLMNQENIYGDPNNYFYDESIPNVIKKR